MIRRGLWYFQQAFWCLVIFSSCAHLSSTKYIAILNIMVITGIGFGEDQMGK